MAWSNLAYVLNQKKLYKEALKACDSTLKYDDSYIDAWINKSHAHVGLEERWDALESIDRAIKLDSTSYKAWFNRGLILFDSKEFDQVKTSFERSVKLNPGFAIGWFYYGTLTMVSEPKKALKYVDSSINLGYRNEKSWATKAFILNLMEKYEEALISYDSSLNYNSANPMIFQRPSLMEAEELSLLQMRFP